MTQIDIVTPDGIRQVEVQLAEAFRKESMRGYTEFRELYVRFARIAAEEIEKARGEEQAIAIAAIDDARMDAARKVVDHAREYLAKQDAARFALPYFDSFQDSDIARIIGADGHEGGGEARLTAPSTGGVAENTALLPRPESSLLAMSHPTCEACYEKARAAAFEECAKIAWEWTAHRMGEQTADRLATRIRAAARGHEGGGEEVCDTRRQESAPLAEPPRPSHLSPTHWTAILNETYAEGRAAAFEEAAGLCEAYAKATGHLILNVMANEIRAAARKGASE